MSLPITPTPSPISPYIPPSQISTLDFFTHTCCRLIIRDTYDEVSEYVASYVAKRINDFKPTASRPFVLGLPTGSSPVGMHSSPLLFFCSPVTFLSSPPLLSSPLLSSPLLLCSLLNSLNIKGHINDWLHCTKLAS